MSAMQRESASDLLPRTKPETAPLLQVRGLVKRFGGLVATDHLDLDLMLGEICGIIGPNGAGKSTLIGLLGGAIKPSDGTIAYCGLDITGMAAAERARSGIGRTYQIPRPFLDMSVEENLEVAQYSLHPFRAARAARDERFDILRRTGLDDCAASPARKLPLLRRKRLEVARALALQPKLLLLDEVGAGLIESEITELIALIKSVSSPDNTIVIIEHVIRVVKECCDRLVVLNFGRKIAEGRTAAVLANDDVAAVYLGTAHRKGAETGAAAAVPIAVPKPAAASDRSLDNPFASLVQAAVPGVGAGNLVELQSVSAGYGQAKVLHSLDLAIRPGDVVAVLGTNGAGKTTLAHVIAGSVKPTAGRLLFDGQDVTGSPSHVMAAKGIAHCMEGRRIFAPLSVEENLNIAARHVVAAERRDRLERVYALFPDLKQRRTKPGTSMSGGQQQMLAIGRALMSRPRLAIFDEISLGLAPVMMDRLYEALKALRTTGLTILIVEQDVDRALALADHVYVLEQGHFALSGTAQELRADARLRHLYIGEPE